VNNVPFEIQKEGAMMSSQNRSTKKHNAFLISLTALFVASLACSLGTGQSAVIPASSAIPLESSPAPSSQPSVNSTTVNSNGDSQVLSDLGSITYTLDSARQVSQDFDINAGKDIILTTKDTNGYGWMLSIPADALLSNQTITMTPFATMDVSQSGAKIISGVQLEPDGLQFVDAVRLSVSAPIDNPKVGLIFSFNQDGSKVAFAPTTNTSGGKTAIATLWHFSAAGYDNEYNAGRDGIDQYQKMAREEYRLALDAAKQFIKNGAPRPPASPSISMFCRGTEVNPEQNEAYEYMREFLDPYSDYVYVLLGAIKDLQLTGGIDVDTSAGTEAIITILQMAEKTLLELANQYNKDKPPDRLIAVIFTGLNIERNIQLINGEAPLLLFPEKISTWASTVRDYYLNELKTKHDYRAFPTILTLEKWVQLVGGTDRLADIVSAMTFEVVLDTSFDGTWTSSGKAYATGRVEQNADVKDITTSLTSESLWGDLDNLSLKVKNGTFKNPTGTYPVPSPYNGQLWLKNWDACVTKSFDVLLSGFSGVEDEKGRNAAGAASRAGFQQYWWDAGFFMFTVPMQNLNPTLGDGSFSGSGSAADGAFTGSGKLHIVIKHTPK
jgi:hypothetical protein